jgi:hypothetical protein
VRWRDVGERLYDLVCNKRISPEGRRWGASDGARVLLDMNGYGVQGQNVQFRGR